MIFLWTLLLFNETLATEISNDNHKGKRMF